MISRLSALALLASALALPAGAATTSTLSAAHATGTALPEQKSDVHSGEFSSSAAIASGSAGASADASVQPGVIKLFASAHGGAGNSVGSSHAEGSYLENITISSAGYDGMQARVTMGVTLQGMIDPVGGGIGAVDFSFMGTGFTGSWSANSDPAFPGGFPVDFVSAVAGGPLFYSAIHDVKVSFTMGTAIPVVERLTLFASKVGCGGSQSECDASASGSVQADFGHSSYWNGISKVEVYDTMTGVYTPLDLGLVSVSSPSGLDWMHSFAPVPEPHAAWLMGAGLALLAIRRRRARS